MMVFNSCEMCRKDLLHLRDIFPEYYEILYIYHFGDLWQHIITLEKIIKSNTFEATYLDGNGSWGYKEYIRIYQTK